MHKATFLEGSLHLTITPDGPILVKAGESGGADPTLPDMEFVRTKYGGGEGKGQVYLPGSSLKGVVRAQAERICRSLDSEAQQKARLERNRKLDPADELVPLADNPLGNGRSYSGLEDMQYSSGRAIEAMKLREHPQPTMAIYRRSSFVSQIFGNTSLAGRVRFADAYPTAESLVEVEERNGVAIDRIYGSVAVGPFNFETVVTGTFATTIMFKNLTLAQLGLLGLALRDLAEGRIGMGFGKSRGLGRVKVQFDHLMIYYPTSELDDTLLDDRRLLSLTGTEIAAAQHLAGVGAFCTGEAYRGYAFPENDTSDSITEMNYPESEWTTDQQVADEPDGSSMRPDELLGVRFLAKGDANVRNVWRACMPNWKRELGL